MKLNITKGYSAEYTRGLGVLAKQDRLNACISKHRHLINGIISEIGKCAKNEQRSFTMEIEVNQEDAQNLIEIFRYLGYYAYTFPMEGRIGYKHKIEITW